MSNAAIDWALAAPIRGVAKPVLVALANRADVRGQCFPLIATICHESGFGDRAVRESLKQLEREGWLTIIRQKGNTLKYQLATERRESSAPRAGPAPDAEHDRPAPDAGESGAKCRTVRQEMPESPAPDAEPITQSNPNLTQNNPKSARERAQKLTPDWEPSEDAREFARSLNLDPDEVLAEFRDHWLARADARAAKTNWDATYRNRCRALTGYAKAKGQKKQWRNGFLQLAVETAQGKPPPAREPNAVEIALGLAPTPGALRRVH